MDTINKELIIQSSPKGVEVALLENKRLVEIHQEKNSNIFNVGDIFLGRVKRVIPGLNAAFIEIGSDKDAFLHYTDLSPNIKSLLKLTRTAVSGNITDPLLGDFDAEPEIPKDGKISDVLKSKDLILVQILKEPIASKGPRLSCEISFPGRNLILSPFANSIGVSRKIGSVEERKRLKEIVATLKPKGFSIVIRTVAEGKNLQVLTEDMHSLTQSWKLMLKSLIGANAPQKLFSELNKSSSILRDLLNASFSKVLTNSPAMTKELEDYISKIAPQKKDIISYYEGRESLFDHYGITKQIKASFGKTIPLASGGYVIIEHTEALHVIDVNSGNRISKSNDQETVAYQVNAEAVSEIARQLRLRDLGGIIIIDFIDMKLPTNRQLIFDQMKKEMSADRATHGILPLTKLNLMQITRSRVKPQVAITVSETCITCNGTGKTDSPLLIQDEIEKDVNYLSDNHKTLTLLTHPFIHAFLTRGFPSIQWKWFLKYKVFLKIRPVASLHLNQYTFKNAKGEEINLE